MSVADGFDGVVLCGGESRRMGTDKALIEIDGQAMAVRVADALTAAGADTVATVGGDRDQLRQLGLDARPDRWPGEGPLGGVIEALRTVGNRPAVVVLSCDLVDPDPVVMRSLVDRLCAAADPADVVVPMAGDRPQWLHGAWRRTSVDVLDAAFSAGERSIVRGVSGLRVERWNAPDPGVLADADVPADLPSRRGHP